MAVNVAIVGATGAVGEMILRVLAERKLPIRSIKFLASQKPELNPATPRYFALLLNSKLLTDVLLPLSSLGVKLPGEAQDIATKVAPLLHDVRLVNEVDGTWHVARVSVNLTEGPAKSASNK